jgi:hypothetical protein
VHSRSKLTQQPTGELSGRISSDRHRQIVERQHVTSIAHPADDAEADSSNAATDRMARRLTSERAEPTASTLLCEGAPFRGPVASTVSSLR